MNECFRDKFIYNNKILNCIEYNPNLINQGKSLYEVIRLIDGIPLFLEGHLERLAYSASVTGLKLWLNESEIESSIRELSKINMTKDGNIKIVFNFNEKEGNNFLALFIRHSYPTEDMYINGVKTEILEAERDNPNAKIINTGLREKSDKIIKEKDLFEVILVDSNGNVTEGSRSNIFMIKGNKVYTAPKEDVLIGITRKYVYKACENLNYEIIERKISYKELSDFDSIFLCGTSPKVLPVSKVDNMEFNSGNLIVQNIRNEYNSIIDRYIKSRY